MNYLEATQLQLSEIEVLKSIYPNEVIINDENSFLVMKRYVETDGKSFVPVKRLSISIALSLENQCGILKLDAELPSEYPLSCLPQIFIRCDNMTRILQQKFNEELQSYMKSIEFGETCLYQIIQWITENVNGFVTPHSEEEITSEDVSDPKSSTVSRFCFYSHHIYNKEKRKSILEWAKELGLNGFSMPGKPGVICIEGLQHNCEQYWQRIKRLSWKHIDVRHREEICDEERNFTDMSEISFEVHGHRNNHMDMGAFYSYLQERRCGHLFKFIFGIEGKSKTSCNS